MNRIRRGFTLIEVLIALTLVSLLMLGLVTALASFGDASARAERHMENNDAQLVLMRFLRGVIASADGRRLWTAQDNQRITFFSGNGAQMQWLGVMPPRPGVGGEYFLRLSVADQGRDGLALMLQYASFSGADASPDWNSAPLKEVLPGLGSVRFSYQAQDGQPWQDGWSNSADLPARIRVDIEAAGTAWPSLVFAVTQADSLGSGQSDIGSLQ